MRILSGIALRILALIIIPFGSHAQLVDSTTDILTDSVQGNKQEVALPDSSAVKEVIDNSQAIEIMMSSQQEDRTSSMREKILQEQIDALKENDIKQRRAIQQQLDDLRTQDSLRRVAQQQVIDSLRQIAIGVPVMLNGDTLYFLYSSFGSFSPNDRAKVHSEKIVHVAKLFSLKTDSLYIVDNNSTSDIYYRDIILATITENDAMWMETTIHELAEQYTERIIDAIIIYKKSISTMAILRTIAFCLMVIMGFYFAIKGTLYLFRQVLDKKLAAKKDIWFRGIHIKNLEVLNSERQLKALLFCSKIVRFLLYAIIFYLAILLLFGIFPPTRRIAETLFGWVWMPFKSMVQGIISYLPNLFKIIVIVLIFRYIIKFGRYLSNEISVGKLVIPGFFADWAKATFNIIRIFLYAFMIILIFPYLPGSDSGVFQGVSVFIGAIFTLGSTSVIGNLMAGMVITYMRPFTLGDRIRIGETVGDVIEKSPFVIRIKTHKNEIVTVPNSTVLSTNVINYSVTSETDNGLVINTTFQMGYEVPWRKVNQLLIDAALRTDFILDTPQPFVLQTSLEEFAATYQLCAYTKNPSKQSSIYSQLHQNIQDVFREAGIEITGMHYQAIRDGGKSTVPPADSLL